MKEKRKETFWIDLSYRFPHFPTIKNNYRFELKKSVKKQKLLEQKIYLTFIII